jgi:Domain of unknown function (DUF397)
MVEPLKMAWRKSSYSGDGANCVEVGQETFGTIIVRDTKNHRSGHLVADSASWQKFVDRIKNT